MIKLLETLNRLARHDKRLAIAGVATAVLAATAAWVGHKAKRAKQEHPPEGAFLNVDNVRLHYIDRGHGTPVVLFHGNAVRLEDFVASGLIDRLAERYRVIAFDRPGFGHSERPRDRLWTAEAQAALFQTALSQLGIQHPVVLGHSWGTLVALALALRNNAAVRALILVSGYYYPTARLDVALAAPGAVPLIGDLMRYTVSAALARLLIGRTVKAMFAPQPVPRNFLPTLAREMLVRPEQIRANAEDAAFMIPAAASLCERYAELTLPTAIFAGAEDKVVDPDTHARQLHAELSNSQLYVLPEMGHMLHYGALEQIVAAIESTQTTPHVSGSVPVAPRPLVDAET